MQDWEEQRELFPTRRKAAIKPPPRPRIRPNFFARLARASANHPVLVLVCAMFLFAGALSFAIANVKLDLQSPIGISVDETTRKANDLLALEFPQTATLIVVRVSAETAETAKAAAQSLAARLETDTANISNAFIPGIGTFYDSFGIYYLDVTDIGARVQRAVQLSPLFQALALSPDLSGLSALINQVATAVQNGRSPRGLENLFTQISTTVLSQAAGKPQPLDWRTVAGLTIENTNKNWVVIIEPKSKRLTQARKTVESLVGTILESEPDLKMVSDFPPGSLTAPSGSTARQIAVFLALAILLFSLTLIFGLQHLRPIVMVLAPIGFAVFSGLAAASIMTPSVDRVTMTFLPAILLPVSALACCMAAALTKPRSKAASAISFIMLAAQQMGPLMLTIATIATGICVSWFKVAAPSLSDVSIVMAGATLAGLASACFLLPSLAMMLPDRSDGLADQRREGSIGQRWVKVRPILAILVFSASLFCIVFFSSVRFGGNITTDVANGVQFIAANEQEASRLSSALKTIPEIGSVRWLGTFMPEAVSQKQKMLQDLSRALEFSGAAGATGPHDPAATLQEIQTGLRTIADGAGTDEGLRASAHELRRSLALLANTSTSIETAALALERLVFSGFNGLPDQAGELANLGAPQVSDFDLRLRKLFVSESGKWRVEVLPKRMISSGAFIEAARKSGAMPLGPIVTANAELSSLREMLTRPLVSGLIIALLASLVYLRNLFDWAIVIVATLMPLPVFAALAVTTDTFVEPLALPALIIAVTASLVLALLSVARKRRVEISLLTVFLPVILVSAIVVPLQLLQITEMQAFSRALISFLVCVIVFNLVVVQQLCTWSVGVKRSVLRLRQPGVTDKPEDKPGENAF
jgi:uncharacterized protein